MSGASGERAAAPEHEPGASAEDRGNAEPPGPTPAPTPTPQADPEQLQAQRPRGVHRIVFGKRVGRPGGPALSSDHEITSVSDGFPDGLRALCLTGALSAGADARELLHPQAPENGGFSIRPVRADGHAYVLAERLALRSEDGAEASARGGGRRHVQAEVWAFAADAFAASAPALLATLPEIVAAEPEPQGARPTWIGALRAASPAEFTEIDHDGAARLAAALMSETELGPFTRADFEDETRFWRAAAALIAELPSHLRVLFSASDGLRRPLDRPLIRYLPQAAGAAHPRGAPDALAQIAERLQGAFAPGWRTAEDAASDLRNLIQDVGDVAAQRSLKRFLTERDSEPARPPEDPHHREVFLRRLIAAAHTGAAFRTALPDFGRARAAGLIACTVDPASEPAWDYIRRTQPNRLFWGAFLLESPGWFEPEPIGSLRALSRLLAFDAKVRAALPPGAATPADGPAFKARLRRLAARGADLIGLDPEALLDDARADPRPDPGSEKEPGAADEGAPDGVGDDVFFELAPWVRVKPDLFAGLPAGAREEVGRALDAVEAAAHVFAEDEPLLAAVSQVRTRSLGERAARDPHLDDARVPLDFALRWMASIEAGSRGGAAFWKAAFERWFETAAETDAGPLDALIAFRRRLQTDKASHDAVARALEAATQRYASRKIAAASPESRLSEALWTWRRLWVQGGPGAAASVRASLIDAASSPEASVAAIERKADETCIGLMEKIASGEGDRDGAAPPGWAAVVCGLDALEMFRRLWSVCPPESRGALRAAYGRTLAGLDRVASVAAPGGGRSLLAEAIERRPALEHAVFDASIGALLDWSAGPAPAPRWPEPRGGAVVKALTARLGGALALYVGRLPGARSAGAIGLGPPGLDDAEASQEPATRRWAAWLADHRAAADRMLAANAIAEWRRGFADALTERAAEDGDAPARAQALSPFPDAEADGLALEALARLVSAEAATAAQATDAGEAERADLDALIGDDARWTLRQFLDLAREPKARAPHAAAPESVRTAWARIAYAKERKDLFEPDMFFLYLASRIAAGGAAAHAERRAMDPISAPFLSMLRDSFHTQRSEAGVLLGENRGLLRAYLWQRPGSEEKGPAIEALEDEEIAARLDRGLLFLALAALDEDDPPAPPDLSRLWAPLNLGAKELQRLHPPPRMTERLAQFLNPEDRSQMAEAHRHYRAALEKVVLHSFSLNKFALWRGLLFAPAR